MLAPIEVPKQGFPGLFFLSLLLLVQGPELQLLLPCFSLKDPCLSLGQETAYKVSEVPSMVKGKISHSSGKKTGGNERRESKASSSGGLSFLVPFHMVWNSKESFLQQSQ